MASKRIVVGGRVQGVGFRAFVCDVAATIGVDGEVWNRVDGSVEILAEHSDDEVLGRFVSTLESGPGRVQTVEVFDAQPVCLRGFRIGPTR